MNFDEHLAAIDERSGALRSAAADTPDLLARVPGCPEWTLRDLIAHLGGVQRFWAAVVRAGHASGPPDPRPDLSPHGDLFEWSAESTSLLLSALREVGPDAPSWTWWEPSGAPQTAGAVARHQGQEVAVHAYDAMETDQKPEPVPALLAADAIDEFLVVSLGSEGAWPHEPATLTLATDEGRSWTVELSADGATVLATPPGDATPARDATVLADPAGDATVLADPAGDVTGKVTATASDLLLSLFGRIPETRLRIDGDPELFGRVRSWADTT